MIKSLFSMRLSIQMYKRPKVISKYVKGHPVFGCTAALVTVAKTWKQPKCVHACVLSRVWLFATPQTSPPGSSIHGIFNARIPDWVAISYSNTLCIWQIIDKDLLYSSFGFKLGKQYFKAIYCHPAYLTSVQSTSCKMPSWKKHKLESRLQGEISIISDTQMTPHLWQKAKKN